MDEHHQRVEPYQLNPALWETLPSDLIDKIVDNVLVRVPVSKILAFCCVCRRWTDFLLSKEYLLYFREGKCMVFNPRTDLWESISLQFCEAQGLTLEGLQLESSGGGSLRFSSDAHNDVVVCNPVTRRCTRLKSSPSRMIIEAERAKGMLPPIRWRVAFTQVLYSSSFSKQAIIVQNVASSPTGYFSLVVGMCYTAGNSFGETVVRDSRSGNWVPVNDVPRDFCFISTPTIQSEGSVILGFCAYPFGFKMLAYDIELKTCGWILNIQPFLGTSESTGFLLASTLNRDSELEFLEVRGTGISLEFVSSPFPPSLKDHRKIPVLDVLQGRGELSHVFNVVHLGQGDIVYHICLCRQPMCGPVDISVWTRIRADSFDHISNWTELEPSRWNPGPPPSARNFHVFKATFLAPG